MIVNKIVKKLEEREDSVKEKWLDACTVVGTLTVIISFISLVCQGLKKEDK